MKIGSLFDGIGGFPLAARRHGIVPAWASEIVSYCIALTRRHFPSMRHVGDVTKIDGAALEPVDVLTFGSPCQDLSKAGKQQGLAGEHSSLFYHAVRIIREMQEATHGKYPALAVWENVPGAFSSNGGRDFGAVLASLVGAAVDVPTKGWTRAGVAFGPQGQAAWRTIDAQFWGVPQRRKRIFLVADFAGQRAGQILFEPLGLSRDLGTGEEAGQGVAGSPAGSVGASSAVHVTTQPQLYDMTHADEVMRPVAPGLAPTLNARMGTGGNQVPVMLQPMAVSENQRAEVRLTPYVRNMTTGGGKPGQGYPAVLQPIAFALRGRAEGNVPEIHGDGGTAGTLRAASGGSTRQFVLEPIAIQHSVVGRADDAGPEGPGYRVDGKMFTLDARGAAHVVSTFDVRNLYLNPELSGTLQAKANGGHSINYQNPVVVPHMVDCRNGSESPSLAATVQSGGHGYAPNIHGALRIGYTVRRLTPTECERLQGYPDGWTEFGVDEAGKRVQLPDTARYRALGNSVAVPCVEFIMRRIVAVLAAEGESGC